MRHLIALLLVAASPVFADCPDPALDAPMYEATGQGLLSAQSWEIRAEGAEPAPCGTWVVSGVTRDQIDGYLPLAPSAVFNLRGMAPHIMTIHTQAQCSARVAVRSGDGLWHFGQDTTTGEGQVVTLWGVPDGPLQVWVGAETRDTCKAIVTLETYDR